MAPAVFCVFDDVTGTASYVVSDPDTGRAAIIDAVLEFDPATGCTRNDLADRLLAHAGERGLSVEWILETHVHADHVSASRLLKDRCGARTGMGRGVHEVHRNLAPLFGLPDGEAREAPPCDALFEDGATFSVGSLECRVLETPGHTPSCVTYVIGDACFVGDTMLMPDSGTARCDFPGGDPQQLYASIQRILALPDETRLFVCHDYGANGKREATWETTVGAQRAENIHVGGGALEHDFVEMRKARDATLQLPRLFIPAVQVNMCAGHLPPPDANGVSYLRVPLNTF